MFTLRTMAIVVTGAGMFAGLPLTNAQACDDDRFPCPVVSEAQQETAEAPAKPTPSAKPRKKANPVAVDKKAQPKVTATRPKTSKPAVQEQAAAPIAPQTSISQNAAEAPPAVVPQAPKEGPNEGLVAVAGTDWPASPNADGVSTTGAKTADAAQAAPANALQVIDANEFSDLDRADIATTLATSSWTIYLLLILGAALAAGSAIWFFARRSSMYIRRAAGPRMQISNP
jgi:hypothetical protein